MIHEIKELPKTAQKIFSQFTPKEFGYRLLVGFLMGAADIVPGVSGGTIAFISGVYEDLVESIKKGFYSSLPDFFKGRINASIASVNWKLFVPLAIGIGIAIVSLSGALEYLLESYPAMTWSFFFGLVAGSVALVYPKISNHSAGTYLSIALGAIVTYFVVGVVPVETPATWWAFLLSGMIAICAMILPGISGSFILLMLGKYQQVLGAVNDRNFVVLALVAIGCVLGLALFSKVLDYVFKHYHDVTVAVLVGVLIGSLRKVWPWKETVQTYIDSHGKEIPLVQNNILPDTISSAAFGILLILFGFGFVLGFEALQNRIKKTKDAD